MQQVWTQEHGAAGEQFRVPLIRCSDSAESSSGVSAVLLLLELSEEMQQFNGQNFKPCQSWQSSLAGALVLGVLSEVAPDWFSVLQVWSELNERCVQGHSSLPLCSVTVIIPLCWFNPSLHPQRYFPVSNTHTLTHTQ